MDIYAGRAGWYSGYHSSSSFPLRWQGAHWQKVLRDLWLSSFGTPRPSIAALRILICTDIRFSPSYFHHHHSNIPIPLHHHLYGHPATTHSAISSSSSSPILNSYTYINNSWFATTFCQCYHYDYRQFNHIVRYIAFFVRTRAMLHIFVFTWCATNGYESHQLRTSKECVCEWKYP